MSSIFYRWFGLGRIPHEERERFSHKEVICWDEGISLTVHFTDLEQKRLIFKNKFRKSIGSFVIYNDEFKLFSSKEILFRLQFKDDINRKVLLSHYKKKLIIETCFEEYSKQHCSKVIIKLKFPDAPQIFYILSQKLKNCN